MNVFVKGSFKKDLSRVSHYDLILELNEKIRQIEAAPNKAHITGLKLLRGYSNHYRIQVKTERQSYRIGAVIRGDVIWLVRFLARKKIYLEFP
jgi:mRNA interferase RelE/StbE